MNQRIYSAMFFSAITLSCSDQKEKDIPSQNNDQVKSSRTVKPETAPAKKIENQAPSDTQPFEEKLTKTQTPPSISPTAAPSVGSPTPAPSAAPGDPPLPTGPTSAAVTVAGGTISFDLGSAKTGLAGATLTAGINLSPASAGGTPSVTLYDFAVKSPATTGLIVFRPVIVKMQDGKEILFPLGNNLTLKMPANRSVPLGGLATVSLSGITAGDSLKIRFSALDVFNTQFIEGVPNYRECKAPASFANVIPALSSCQGCHSGLFSYAFFQRDTATACGLNLKIIDAMLSPTLTTPNIPTGAHNGANATPARSAITIWRAAEGL